MVKESTATSPISPEDSRAVANEGSDAALERRILELSDRITALAGGQCGPIAGLAAAQQMAQTIKPYVDRLCALRRLLTPVGSIAAKRVQIDELRERIAEDVAVVETLSDDVGNAVDPALLSQLEGELASVKRDRKLFVQEIAADDLEAEPKPVPSPMSVSADAPLPLAQLPVQKRLKLILGRRFVSVPDLAGLLSLRLDEGLVQKHEAALEHVWRTVFDTEELRPHVARNRVRSLQKAFSDYGLLLRTPQLDRDTNSSLATLRERHGSFFLHARDQGLWYAKTDLYHATFAASHWALVDRQYLNCTFKKPSIRLLMYARANGLPPAIVRQKSLLEDVYDRIVLGLAVNGQFFANCHSITRTTYQQSKNAIVKQAYVYERDGSIRISGKRGTPHWRPTRPRWPGVLPAIVLPT
jgi:hypothetical protein